LRIIAGEFGGRRIGAPPGHGTRPMLDRVREAVFSTLGDRIDGARVLDLFAGTGSLGLEALSRGALHVSFFERDRRTADVLRANVAALGVETRAKVNLGDALDERRWGDEPFDVLFLDPPYPFVREGPGRRKVFDALHAWFTRHATPAAIAMLHVPRYALGAREFTADFVADERVYGTNAIWYVERVDRAMSEG
jgi:16S rRNA (guanine966-N2)-methyltransferase